MKHKRILSSCKFFHIKFNKILTVFFVFGFCLFLYVPLGFAHKVIIFAWVENGFVHTESSFGGNKKVHFGEIKVFDINNNLIKQGSTDENGKFSFRILNNINSDIIIELNAGPGHKATWKISKQELAVKDKSLENIKKIREQKYKIFKNSSFFSIIGGILIIFSLAFLAKYIMRKKNK
ncbi:MAG: hypothetical protein B6I26_01565 [Desulfobacteraceae bacterium 4572_130]|nr:MAG: hypothetical protein B6I26_01565 [Desulfobacteraceae bacterium 4572_130]